MDNETKQDNITERKKVLLSPNSIKESILTIQMLRDAQAIDNDEYILNLRRLTKFWRRLMKAWK